MTHLLLDRQLSLLDYLTSRAAIFGDRGACPPPLCLADADVALLRLEARFSHEKRMGKITGILPKTFAIGGGDLADVVRAFVEANPSTDISRLANARQFYFFLRARTVYRTAGPPHLSDVAACELALAEVKTTADAAVPNTMPSRGVLPTPFRRHRNSRLLHCNYDVRSVFEQGSTQTGPLRRDLRLAVGIPAGMIQPAISEVSEQIYALLDTLSEDWIDPSRLSSTGAAANLLVDLTRRGLLEFQS